jgi:hypothetical protein|nr:MAG TPA: hypothetical protein [Caudoviricetes sp.]
MNNADLDDFFNNLFSDKFDKKYKLNILTKLEADSELHLWIEKYHPKYCIDHIKDPRRKVMTINLVMDLKLI